MATLVLLELRLTVSGVAGVGARSKVRSCAEPALMVSPHAGCQELVPWISLTWTWTLAGVKPGADAVMVADPGPMPLTSGYVAGNVFLAAMRTLGVTVAAELSLLVSETVAPPAGAGADTVSWSTAD